MSPSRHQSSDSADASRQRSVLFLLVGRRYLALDCWHTPTWLRLAQAGGCPICHATFQAGVEAAEDAYRHIHESTKCCRELREQIDTPAWYADQARLERRGRSTGWYSVRRGYCARCGRAFLSIWPRIYCGAPLCDVAGRRARKTAWRDAHPAAGMLDRTCEACERPFSARRRDARYCGPTCRQRARRRCLRRVPANVMFSRGVTAGCGPGALTTDV